MKAFTFRLDPVIRYRAHLERIALMELAKAKQFFVETKRKIQDLKRDRSGAIADLRAEEIRGIDICRHRIFMNFLRGLSAQISAENDRLIDIAATVKEKQEIFDKERIKKESLVLLRQKEHSKYIQEIDRAEQKAADELMSLRWKNDDVITEG